MTNRPKVSVSCVILTLNEEDNISAVIDSLRCADQIVVVDSGSSDQTVRLSTALGAQVLENEWPGYAEQRNWALAHPALHHDWVLFVDADERVTSEGWTEIDSFLTNPRDYHAADFRRAVYLFGRQLKHGGFNTARVTRLLHRQHCRFLERPVHEHAIVDGRVHHMSVAIRHHDLKPFSAWLDRHNSYSSLEAAARLQPPEMKPTGPAARKQWLRTHIWQRLPARPLLMFVYIYIGRLGFLDGKAGLRIAASYAFQELSIQVKMEEFQRAGDRTSDSRTGVQHEP